MRRHRQSAGVTSAGPSVGWQAASLATRCRSDRSCLCKCCTCLHKDDPALPSLQKLNEPLHVIEENPTAEAIARLIFEHVKRLGFPVTALRLWETDQSSATYTH